MPEDTRFFMCHDSCRAGVRWPSRRPVREQKRHNIQINERTLKEEYVAFREKKDATLEAPTLILPSLQVNIRAGELPVPEANGMRTRTRDSSLRASQPADPGTVRVGCEHLVSAARSRWAGALLVLMSCVPGGMLGSSLARAETASPKPKIAATIFPLYDIARQVAGPVADVVLILPPGASPHTFEPTPAAIRSLGDARTLLVVGHGLDDWAARLAQGAGVPRLVRVDADISLRRYPGRDPASVDPHYWLSLRNGKAIARTVAAELELLSPDRGAELRSSLAAYLARLDNADEQIRELLANLPSRRIAIFHDAFGYFADAYGLEVAAVFEPYPGREPGPRFVIDFQEKIRASQIRVVFSEPQLSVDAIRPLAHDLGVTISMLDPLGGVPGRESYVETALFNARQIAAALRAPPP
jgi:ABC-type Zn uptake system ZnuABC Zn-binding protein ZnuA